MKALAHTEPGKVGICDVGTGKDSSVNDFGEACKKAADTDIQLEYLSRRQGNYAEVYSDPRLIMSLAGQLGIGILNKV